MTDPLIVIPIGSVSFTVLRDRMSEPSLCHLCSRRKVIFKLIVLHLEMFTPFSLRIDESNVVPRGGIRSPPAAQTIFTCREAASDSEGLCTETKSLCEGQGGRFLGYCFYNATYQGICCSNLSKVSRDHLKLKALEL